jgi:transcriptional regulator with XRE-family HTH domain
MEQFAEWLKDQLKVMDISQAELSRRSGLSVAQISRIVNKISPPGDKAIQLMADALGLPRDLLYRKSGKLPPEPARTDLIDQILHKLIERDLQSGHARSSPADTL